MEQSILAEALKGLITAGPVALILGVLCWALWKQNLAREARIERQHEKMLKLAVRVQRAVEVLAGIDARPTQVEEVLDDDAKAKRREKPDDDF